MAKKKPAPEAPRAVVKLRNFEEADWRWPIPDGTRVYMRRRVGVGMPDEMREAIEAAAARTGFSMSEIGRRCFKAGVISSIKPRGI